MYSGFSNEVTAKTFDSIVDRPGLHDRVLIAIQTTTATKVASEIRTFVTTELLDESPADMRDLVDAALRTVRWGEIRDRAKADLN